MFFNDSKNLIELKEDDVIKLSFSYHDNTNNMALMLNNETNKKIEYKNYNKFGLPELFIFDGLEITSTYDAMGRKHIVSSIEGSIEYTLDGEGNELLIKNIDKKGKESLTTQTFDPYSHLITKEYKGYKLEYDYYDNNKIRKLVTYFNGEKIEAQKIKYNGEVIEEISSINNADKEYSVRVLKNGKIEEFYNIDNVRYDILKNEKGLVEKIEMARQEIITHQYNENSTVTNTANDILILETEDGNTKTTSSKDMGKTVIITEDGISKINRNGNEFSNKMEDEKIIEHVDVGGVSILYSYDEEELVKITKNNDYIEFTNKEDVSFVTSKTSDITDVLEYGEDYLIYPSGHKIQYLFDENDQLIGINFNDQIVTKDMVSNGGVDFKSFGIWQWN